MNIPGEVSGRPVTNRGVHLHPFGYHDYWMERADYWIGLLQSMHMSWVLALSEGDALYISGAAEALLDGGIIPIVRPHYQFPGPFTAQDAVAQLANLYARYNAPLIVQIGNEPFDPREWENGNVPPEDEAWAIIRDRWNQAAGLVVERGGFAGFPDGPGYSRNPFEIIGDPGHFWQDGKAVYLGHFYGKGRPVDYPYDPVSRTGEALTMEQYREALDDWADDPAWNEGQYVLDLMNQQRQEWAARNQEMYPDGITALDDDICFNGWQKIMYWSRQTFGFEVPIAMTEGGWVPRDRAGSGNNADLRWPYTTPKVVGKKTLAMYEADTPMFAITPWLLADEDMGGVGWPYDSWVGWAYSERYGREKPVVQTLQDNPPDGVAAKVSRIAELAQEVALFF
jgi:hypothetical protein